MKNIYTFFIASCLTIIATAQGCLDNTFGIGGIITGAIKSGNSIAIQPDGKIIVAGSDYHPRFALVRYNSNGSYDRTFGPYPGGVVTTDLGNGNDEGTSVAIQQDGKIILAGASYNGTDADFGLTRYDSIGSLDTTFGFGGKVTTGYGSFGSSLFDNQQGNSVALQQDGKIIVAGSNAATGSNSDFALARYNSNGMLDTTFGLGGSVTTDFSSGNDVGHSIAIQINGKILVAGTTNTDFALAQYNSNGNLDTAFGTGGKVTTDFFGGNDGGFSIAIQQNEKIIVAGTSYSSGGNGNDFAIARYNADGSLDAAFGSGGKVVTDIGGYNDYGSAVAIEPNGKILVAGTTANFFQYQDFALVRYDTTGSVDNTFCLGGKVTTNIGSSDDLGNAVAIQADGKIVVTGIISFGSMAVVRYTGLATEISDIENNTAFTLYPNPTTSQLFIQSNTEIQQVNIYNTTGSLVMVVSNSAFSNQNSAINVQSLSGGVYIAEIKTTPKSPKGDLNTNTVRKRWVKM